MSRYPHGRTMLPNLPESGRGIPGSIDALAELLQRELTTCGVALAVERPTSVGEFTHWYLQVVQLLEAHVADTSGRQSITRSEVELMCRCALSAGNLRQAMALCQQYCMALSPRAGRLKTVQAAGTVSFRLDSLRATTSSTSSLCDITGLFAFYQLFQWLVGADLRLQQVKIGPIDREDVLPFLQLFGAPVLAGGQEYALEFPAAVMELPVVRSAAEFAQFFEVFPCGVFRRPDNKLAEQVAMLLWASARQGGGLPRQEDVADSLGMSLSTFRRQLALEGSPFQQLRENCLRERAEALLGRSECSIADTATQLGYSDSAAFRRAFRQWHGCSPGVWRRRLRVV